MPDHSRRRNSSSRIGPRALVNSSMNGATSTAVNAMGSPRSLNQLADASLTSNDAAVETKAPQAKQKIRYLSGSGSYRSNQRKQATSTGTGRIAAAVPISSASPPRLVPRVTSMKIAQAAISRMTPANTRPRRQPSRRRGIPGTPLPGGATGTDGDGGSAPPDGVSAMRSA